MKQLENIHRLFDGELSADEKRILEEVLAADPELGEELKSLEMFAELHRSSIPEPKDEVFIEKSFLEIQRQLTPRSSALSKSTNPSEKKEASKVVMFPGSRWVFSITALAAALAVTVTGAWMWKSAEVEKKFSQDTAVKFVETDIVDASSMIFMDEQSGWTFVWVDEPSNTTSSAG